MMDGKPMVSVVMPAFNAEKYIKGAIESILDQTYANLELVIVEDRSTDKTRDVLKKYESVDRIRIMYNESNKGIAYSTNLAVKESRGELIALHDDDDISARERLEQEVDYLVQHPEIDVLGSGSYTIDRNDRILSWEKPQQTKSERIKSLLLFRGVGFKNGTAMIRRRFITDNDLWYEDDCLGMQDHVFYIKASKTGKIAALPNPLYGWRKHGMNESVLQLLANPEKRSHLYNELRSRSLQMSGFQLSREDMDLLNGLLPERTDRTTYKLSDLKELRGLFECVLSQARDMKIDYFDDLETVCKKLLSECVLRTDIF